MRRPSELFTNLVLAMTVVLVVFQVEYAPSIAQTAANAKDPGVRGGALGAGGPLTGLTATQSDFATRSLGIFSEVEAVSPDGLGPRMNLDSCAGCHAYPSVGGSSPAVNPQVEFATKNGGTDKVPSFLDPNGPIREARFITNPDGTPDGGVHALFTITGRTGATGCSLQQPDFATQLRNNNVIFRIPTPVFGAGLIEFIPDGAILSNQANNDATNKRLGIKGHSNLEVTGRTMSGETNNSGNDGTITRFGWKAQNKSLLMFAGEAYNVEMGISNDLFQTERDETPTCQFAAVPNSTMTDAATTPFEALSDIDRFVFFMRTLAPPAPSLDTPGGTQSIANGKTIFSSVGCANCHTPSFTTGKAYISALSNQPVNLFSDLLVHDMGKGLADGVSQGSAGPQEFRSAPLWGLGQRTYFLHDGRTSDLLVAIQAHDSPQSEATTVIKNFNALSEAQKQDLLNFLRSL